MLTSHSRGRRLREAAGEKGKHVHPKDDVEHPERKGIIMVFLGHKKRNRLK